jgi:hypothetical protein
VLIVSFPNIVFNFAKVSKKRKIQSTDDGVKKKNLSDTVAVDHELLFGVAFGNVGCIWSFIDFLFWSFDQRYFLRWLPAIDQFQQTQKKNKN